MKHKATAEAARLLLSVVIHTGLFLGPIYANDPFEGNIFPSNCMKRRDITCSTNETLLSSYKRTELSKSDQNINAAKTEIYLFTPCNKEEAEFLHDCGGWLPENTNYRAGEKTVVLVFGYISSPCHLSIAREIVQQLLCRKEFINVIVVAWNWGNGPDYYSARRNTEVVAKQLAYVLSNIMDQKGVPPENIHIVGHSLGAQIAGCTGEYLQKLGKGQIGRITALDPAAPGYKDSKNCSISPDDAKKVDAMHTNAAECLPLGLGMTSNVGHADFYPNKGSFQSACYVTLVEAFLKCDFYYVILLLLGPFCPHFQSLHYFKESINACGRQFVGVQCTRKDFKAGNCQSCDPDGSKCAVMGYDWDQCDPKFGNISYYLKTGIKCPTCNNEGIDLGGFSTSPPKCGKAINCYKPGNYPKHDC